MSEDRGMMSDSFAENGQRTKPLRGIKAVTSILFQHNSSNRGLSCVVLWFPNLKSNTRRNPMSLDFTNTSQVHSM